MADSALALNGNVANSAQKFFLNNGYPIRAFGLASPALALIFGLPAADMPAELKRKLRWQRAKNPKGEAALINHQGTTIGTRALTRDSSWDVTPDTDPNTVIGNKFPWVRRIQTLDYPGMDLDQTEEGYFDIVRANEDSANEGLAAELSTALFDTGSDALGTDNQIASLEYMVSDGTTTGETAYAMFGQRDRALSANASLRSQVVTSFGDMTKTGFRELVAYAKRKSSRPKLFICNDLQAAAWFDVFGEADNVTTKYDPILMEMGADYASYNNVVVVGDQYCPAGTGYLLDPDSFVPFWRGMGKDHKELPSVASRAQLFNVDDREDLFRAKRIWWLGLFCQNPRANLKVKGITVT